MTYFFGGIKLELRDVAPVLGTGLLLIVIAVWLSLMCIGNIRMSLRKKNQKAFLLAFLTPFAAASTLFVLYLYKDHPRLWIVFFLMSPVILVAEILAKKRLS